MGFLRFRRSIKIAPGIRWNIGKKSTSLSVGPRGLKLTAGTHGVRTTVGIPGTGISYTSQPGHRRALHQAMPVEPSVPSSPQDRRLGALTTTVVMGVVAVFAFTFGAPTTGGICALLAFLAFCAAGPRTSIPDPPTSP